MHSSELFDFASYLNSISTSDLARVKTTGIVRSHTYLFIFPSDEHPDQSQLEEDHHIMDGRCQCGAIQFKTPTPAPSKIYICHCTECRHQSSSAFGISARFPSFEIPSPHPGAISIFSRQTLSGRTVDGLFCTKCGSRLMHRAKGEKLLSVKAGCLEGLDLKGAVHIWCKEAIVDVPAGAERYDEMPTRE